MEGFAYKGRNFGVLGAGEPQNLIYADCNPKRHICRSFRVFWVFMRQNRSMALAWPRSREMKKKENKKKRKQEKNKKSHARSIFCQNSTSHGGATGYSIGTKFGRLVGPFHLITHANLSSIDEELVAWRCMKVCHLFGFPHYIGCRP